MTRMISSMKTAALLGALMGLCLLVGYGVGGPTGMLLGLMFGGIGNLVMYFFSDRIAIRAMQGREVTRAEEPWLVETVERLAHRARLPMPRVYVCPQDAPNAFATGRNPRHSAVAITEGMLHRFPEHEIAAVMAHELGHIKHRDVLITTLAAVMGGIISYAGYALMFSPSDEEEGGGGLLGVLIAALVAPIAAMLIQFGISRSREYAADAYAGELCGDPQHLASALNRLQAGAERHPMDVNPAYQSMFIVQPLSLGGRMASLFSTHPPVEKRIAALMQQAHAMNPRGIRAA